MTGLFFIEKTQKPADTVCQIFVRISHVGQPGKTGQFAMFMKDESGVV
ncbi:MAG: hypothetical protein OS112_05465 [Methanoregula sp.]|nr:MAG: hypothetical protein OS112_05465 [Methanoregula sp.]